MPTLPTTFNFLRFLHVWGTSRRGNRVVRRQTAKDRFARALAVISALCHRMRTEPLVDQQRKLSRSLKGHFADFGISGTYRRLKALSTEAWRIWKK